MAHSSCPDCETRVYIGSRAEIGDQFRCPKCDMELELVWMDPPELDYFWEYDDDETMIYDDMDPDP